MSRHDLDFRFVHEPEPADAWAGLFAEFWPAFRRWYFRTRPDDGSAPDYATCTRMLRRHLPSMVPVHAALGECAGGGDDAGRFLTLYDPPPSIRGCTQAIVGQGDDIALVRNYDFAPRLCDGVVLRSAWSGVDVIAMTDCLAGALDGMNAHGLVASLAFGGDPAVGSGFGTVMLVRAVLEACASVPEAIRLIADVPVHMAYTVTLLDRGGTYATVHLRPGLVAHVTDCPVAANHQAKIVWPAYARFSQTVERQARVERLLLGDAVEPAGLVHHFLEPPLYRRAYGRSSGTLYTAVYTPCTGTLDLHWPDVHRRVGFDSFPDDVQVIQYEAGAAAPAKRDAGPGHADGEAPG